MRAIRISAPIGVDGLVYEDAPDPTPAIRDVLVRVHACGITADELFWPLYADRAGRDRTPLIPGQDSPASSSRSDTAPLGWPSATRCTG